MIYNHTSTCMMLMFLLCQQNIMLGPVVLCLLWSVVEVHSQRVPNITFMGVTLPNHGYVDFSLVGDATDGSDSVQCHTDLVTCCSSLQDTVQGTEYRGNWYAPGYQRRLPFSHEGTNIYERHATQRIELRRRGTPDRPSGIYHCLMPTNAVSHPTNRSVRESTYVGVYASGGINNCKCIRCVYVDRAKYQFKYISKRRLDYVHLEVIDRMDILCVLQKWKLPN